MNKLTEVKNVLRRDKWCFWSDRNTIVVDMLGVTKEATRINKDQVLVKLISDRTGLVEDISDLISSDLEEIMEKLAPITVDFPYMSNLGTLIYSDQFSLGEAVEYIQNYLEKKGDEIKPTKEKFNELLNKEDLSKDDLKKFQKHLQLNNKKGIRY
jgi:hypothetical protein